MKNSLSAITLLLFSLLSLSSCDDKANSLGAAPTSGENDLPVQSKEEIQYGDDILVKTLQIGGENAAAANNFQVSYPHTSYDFVNAPEEEFALEFRDEFTDEVGKTVAGGVAGITFLQHFDVLEHSDSLMAFLIERSRSYGNNFDDQLFARYYDLKSGRMLPIDEVFRDTRAFQRFADVATTRLLKVMKEKVFNDPELSDEDKQTLYNSMQETALEGSTATPDNYNSVIFGHEDEVTVRFDKYQVAPGSMGVIEVKIPKAEVSELLNPRYRSLLHVGDPTDAAPSVVPQRETPPRNRDEEKDERGRDHEDRGGQEQVSDKAPDKSGSPMVALTFDDGPSIYTPRLLDILKDHDVKVTFFVLGKSAKVQRNTVLRAFDEGHQIANHSWNHKNLTQVSAEELKKQIFNTNEVVAEITDKAPDALRPPYGAIDKDVKATSNLPLILWNIDPEDWKDRDSRIVADRMSKAGANSIVLAHDIHETTVEAIPAVIEALRAKGFRFVTIDEMFADRELKEGEKYFHR